MVLCNVLSVNWLCKCAMFKGSKSLPFKHNFAPFQHREGIFRVCGASGGMFLVWESSFCVRVYVCLSLYPRLPSFWGCVCAWVCLRACVRSARFDYSTIMLKFARIIPTSKQSLIYDIKS